LEAFLGTVDTTEDFKGAFFIVDGGDALFYLLISNYCGITTLLCLNFDLVLVELLFNGTD
jgi:hypothetical protein